MAKKRGTIPRLKGEIWEPINWIKDKNGNLFEDFFVSNMGRVRRNKRILKQCKNSDGYLTVYIGERKYLVHRLVATAFCPNPKGFPVVDHNDSNKTNNKAINLEWVTIGENTRRGYKTDNYKKRGHRNVLALDDEDNGTLYSTNREASSATGVSVILISKITRGLLKSAKGFRFIKIKNIEDKRGKTND